MRIAQRLCLTLLLAAGLGPLAGCFGSTQNPSYFPYLLPTGDIIRTHAKPPGRGYFANFDPHAVRLEVRPLESTSAVGAQHLLIATVYDEDNKPRRKRRVEWMLEGAGNIIETDESGFLPGRGYKVDNKYAVSFTDFREHRITRGNGNPNDDFVIRPGQTWCVISAAVEGDTHVTVYAPEVYNWDHNKVTVTTHWVDAEWALPQPAVVRAGTPHVLTTTIFRHTDRQPLANYRVRYRLLDGPPVVFLPDRSLEFVAVSNLDGNAGAAVVQAQPGPGVSRIGVEIIRAPDPSLPSAAGIVIGRGETTVEWQAPAVSLTKAGPPAVAVGQEVPYTLTVSNTGPVESRNVTVRDLIPEGLQYVRSQSAAVVEGNQLVWALGELPGRQSRTIDVVFRSTRTGPVTNQATVITEEGLRDEKSVTTQITSPQLKIGVAGPENGTVGTPVTYQITVSNPGTGPAANVLLRASFDVNLEHETRANPVDLPLGTLATGESKTVPLNLTPLRAGRLIVRVVATADGNLTDRAEHLVNVQEARLGVNLTGPARRYADRPAEWNIQVANSGDVALTNVVVRDLLPAELAFTSASDDGQFEGGEVVWKLGTLQPREQKLLQVTTRCAKLSPRALNKAIATADPGTQAQAEAPIEILGLPAFRLDVKDTDDGIEVGGKTTYLITVTNQGSLAGNEVEIVAEVPEQMRVLGVRGPSDYRAEGQRVVFRPVDNVQPKQVLNYAIEVQALKPGDARFRARLRAQTLSEPGVLGEESTNIYTPGGMVP